MTQYTIALFVHLFVVVSAFSMAWLIHHGLFQMHRARTVAEARAAVGLVGRLGPRMPLYALALFLSGAWLTAQRWPWNTPWLTAAFIGLTLMLVFGVAVLRPRLLKLRTALGEQDGPIPAPARTLMRDGTLWVGANVQPMIAMGIMFDMTIKPTLGASLGFIGIAMGVGALAALPFVREKPVA